MVKHSQLQTPVVQRWIRQYSSKTPLILIHWMVIHPLDGAIHHLKTLFEPLPPELLSRSSNVGAARKVFPY